MHLFIMILFHDEEYPGYDDRYDDNGDELVMMKPADQTSDGEQVLAVSLHFFSPILHFSVKPVQSCVCLTLQQSQKCAMVV